MKTMACVAILTAVTCVALLGSATAWGDGVPGNGVPDVTYNPNDGTVYFDADGLSTWGFRIAVSSDLVIGTFPEILEPPNYWEDWGQYLLVDCWSYRYDHNRGEVVFECNTEEYWVGILDYGEYHVMTLVQGLTDAHFGGVIYEQALGGSTHVTVLPPLHPLGDLDGDGFVGQDDLDIVLGAWGTRPPSDPRADPDGNDLVAQNDLDTVLLPFAVPM